MASSDNSNLFNANLMNSSAPSPIHNYPNLEELFSPVSRESFVSSYFAKKALHVKGSPEKFNNIFSQEKLQRALSVGQKIPDRRYNITASFTGGEKAGSPRPPIPAYYDQISELHNAGATICITNIHMADPTLAQWAQRIRAELNFSGTVGVNCYVSPDGSGLPMHYDRRIATSLQISGRKRWIYSTETAKPWPSHNGRYYDGKFEPPEEHPGKLPHEMELNEVILDPGDLLSLPAGAWHSARAVGDCMAINVYFAPRNFVDHITPFIQNFAFGNESWRAGPPASFEGAKGNTPESVSAYLRDRLQEFHDLTKKLLDGPDAMLEPWLESLSLNPYTGWRPAQKPSPKPKNENQRFTLSGSSINFVELGDHVLVASDYGAIKLPKMMLAILKGMAEHNNSFSVQDILSWREGSESPTMEQIIPCIQSLIEKRVIDLL
jgi:hypothetical protein